jgi:dihydroorotate dehydrogenase electron transfer subunit
MIELKDSGLSVGNGGGVGLSGSALFCSEREVWSGEGLVVGNERVAEFTFKLSVAVEGGFPEVQSGQFVMIRLAADIGLLLGRPLAIYRVRRGVVGIGGFGVCDIVEVIYLAAGRVTSRFSGLAAGSRVRFWGPLGRGFDVEFSGHTILVAGGVGHTPFLMLAEKLSRLHSSYSKIPEVEHANATTWSGCSGTKPTAHTGFGITLLYGARDAGRVVPLDDFEKLGVDVRIATDDGSIGFKGFVTTLVDGVYRRGELTRVLCCGSAQMLKAAFETAKALELPCVVSLETPMSCGLGICYGCVVKVKDNNDANGWSYQRTCIEGPAFDAYKLMH